MKNRKTQKASKSQKLYNISGLPGVVLVARSAINIIHLGCDARFGISCGIGNWEFGIWDLEFWNLYLGCEIGTPYIYSFPSFLLDPPTPLRPQDPPLRA